MLPRNQRLFLNGNFPAPRVHSILRPAFRALFCTVTHMDLLAGRRSAETKARHCPLSHSALAEPEKRQCRRVSKCISDLMAHSLRGVTSNPFVAHPTGKTGYSVVVVSSKNRRRFQSDLMVFSQPPDAWMPHCIVLLYSLWSFSFSKWQPISGRDIFSDLPLRCPTFVEPSSPAARFDIRI